MFTTRLRLCKCWEISCACTVAFQEGEVGLLSLEWHWVFLVPGVALGVVTPGVTLAVAFLRVRDAWCPLPVKCSVCWTFPQSTQTPHTLWLPPPTSGSVPSRPTCAWKPKEAPMHSRRLRFFVPPHSRLGNRRHQGGSKERILTEQRSRFAHILAHTSRMQRAEPDRAGNMNLGLIYS